jgi:hypothetical protein
VTKTTATLAAALCACVLLVLPASALAANGTCVTPFSGMAAETIADESRADIDVAAGPEVGGVSVKHATRKPRRSNRRLRNRGRDRLQSACTRAALRTSKTAYMDPKRKRHTGKRSLMRRLMTVRGGLQA